MRKTLIFIVAYDAEKLIESVLNRIPTALYADPNVHVLVIDDASSDASSTVAAQWVKQNKKPRVKVLRNPVNQGYGGNQKLGYRYAIDNGFDRVVLLHGDGQYAPEAISDLLAAMSMHHAQVVLGTRMHSLSSARRGGMPLYKILGNVLLTKLQNFISQQRLSEFHTGFRAYSTSFLRQINFELNTNDFHFDTEILLQAFHAEAKVVEVPIATHYGEEKCHVNSISYGFQAIRSTLQFACHRLGVFCSLKYRRLAQGNYDDKTKVLGSTHALALELAKKFEPTKVYDLGSGPGYVAAALERANVAVTAVDVVPPKERVRNFVRLDLERDKLAINPQPSDVVLALDVIEHLAQPEKFLLDLREQTATDANGRGAVVILSTPNVAFFTLRLSHLLGRFAYAERGILDITHKRLFTLNSLTSALRDCGYDIEKVFPVGVPFGLVISGFWSRLLGRAARIAALLWPRGFAFQFLVVARPRPSVAQILANATEEVESLRKAA
jgi:glycosyltransferase involved in cell wall biosynthesis